MPDSMAVAVRRLRLTAYRSYSALDLELTPSPVLLFGPNGSGKTNLLEAVSFLTPGRGLRGAGADAVARKTDDGVAPGWGVWALADTREGEVELGAGAQGGRRRETRIHGDPAPQSELGRLMPMIWLTPAHDRLFAGPRADRLKFFDRLVYAADPAHADAASAYEKIRSRRQKLLEDPNADAAWLDALETEMAGHGVAMAAARLEALIRLQAAINDGADAKAEAVFPRADVALEGAVEADLAEGMDIGEAEDRFAAALRAGRRRDAAAGRTLTAGPHRTELAARHREKGQPAADCSTGEQKALILSLALAQADVLARRSGAAPLLLLDEACAHLDQRRRDGLAARIETLGAQAWLSGVEGVLFEAFAASAQRFEIAPGEARPV